MLERRPEAAGVSPSRAEPLDKRPVTRFAERTVNRTQGASRVSTQPSGIHLNSKPSLWFFLVQVFPLLVTVDGQQSTGKWGEQFIGLAPGQHRIEVAWKMYWLIPVNRGTLDVTVNPGQVVPVRYKVRYLWIMAGKLFIDQPSAQAPQAA
jgi:hypothetical protein